MRQSGIGPCNRKEFLQAVATSEPHGHAIASTSPLNATKQQDLKELSSYEGLPLIGGPTELLQGVRRRWKTD